MISVAIYYLETGEISRFLDTSYVDVAPSLLKGEDFYLNCPRDATHIINNEPVTLERIYTTTEQLLFIRNKRGLLLSACDWTQTLDAPLTPEKKAEWAAYRQALRDFPDTCDPSNPIWPTPPI